MTARVQEMTQVKAAFPSFAAAAQSLEADGFMWAGSDGALGTFYCKGERLVRLVGNSFAAPAAQWEVREARPKLELVVHRRFA